MKSILRHPGENLAKANNVNNIRPWHISMLQTSKIIFIKSS